MAAPGMGKPFAYIHFIKHGKVWDHGEDTLPLWFWLTRFPYKWQLALFTTNLQKYG
jgi:hypothetical protein